MVFPVGAFARLNLNQSLKTMATSHVSDAALCLQSVFFVLSCYLLLTTNVRYLFDRSGVEWSAGPTPRHTSTMDSGKLACVVVFGVIRAVGVFLKLECLPYHIIPPEILKKLSRFLTVLLTALSSKEGAARAQRCCRRSWASFFLAIIAGSCSHLGCPYLRAYLCSTGCTLLYLPHAIIHSRTCVTRHSCRHGKTVEQLKVGMVRWLYSYLYLWAVEYYDGNTIIPRSRTLSILLLADGRWYDGTSSLCCCAGNAALARTNLGFRWTALLRLERNTTVALWNNDDCCICIVQWVVLYCTINIYIYINIR